MFFIFCILYIYIYILWGLTLLLPCFIPVIYTELLSVNVIIYTGLLPVNAVIYTGLLPVNVVIYTGLFSVNMVIILSSNESGFLSLS